MTDLYPFQHDVVDRVAKAIDQGKRRIIIVAPTGAGKTVIGAEIIKKATDNGQRVLLLAHTREIIGQTSRKMYEHGVSHGIVQAGFPTRPDELVQVASVQTLWVRAMRLQRMQLPPADMIIVDECHHAPATTYSKIINSFPDAIIIGLTATPSRGDGRGLGGIFDVIVEAPQVAELIALKYLVPAHVYAPAEPDLTGVETRVGDYVESQLAERLDRGNLVGDIVAHWHKYAERRKTVCFAVNVAHSIHIRDEFINSGVRAEHIDGGTPKAERDAVLARLASGQTDLVTNCMVLTEGWNMPEVSCCILARPTKKMGLYRQMVGRALRPAPAKHNAIVLDHSGAVYRHGFVEDPVAWTLDPDRRSESPRHAARLRSGYSSRMTDCIRCGATRVAGEPCQRCGHLPQRAPKAIVFQDGELARVDRKQRRAQRYADPNERIVWQGMLAHIAKERGYKAGWVSHKFKEKFGQWPAAREIRPIEPSAEVRSWVRSRAIAFAKGKERRA